MHLNDLGERKLINRIWDKIGRKEEYDDCVYILRGDHYELITTDFIGEKTHFMKDWSPYLVGKFFASLNLSDIAAMGGIPEIFMASLFFSRDYPVDYLDDFIKGMNSLLEEFNTVYRGGDLKESLLGGMSGIAIGWVEKDKILRRKGAMKDDGIYVTGELGKQAAGYYLWKQGVEEGYKYLLDIYPRVNEGRILAGRATSCMDISDGLNSTINQMENINGLGFKIYFDELPIHKLAFEVSEEYGIPIEHLVLEFGGEYELFYTSPEKIVGREIGTVDKKGGIFKNGKLMKGGGYEHFSKILEKIRG